VNRRCEPVWRLGPRGTKPAVSFPFGNPILPLALSPPTGIRTIMFPLHRPSPRGALPERCSPARVRFAAPKTGAPLPAPRRSGHPQAATGGSDGNMIERQIRFFEPDREVTLIAGAYHARGLHFHLTQPRPVWVTSLNDLTGGFPASFREYYRQVSLVRRAHRGAQRSVGDRQHCRVRNPVYRCTRSSRW